MRSERKKMFEPPQLPSYFENIDFTRPATLIPPTVRPHNVMQGITNERAGRVAPALAGIMLTPSGPQMDQLVREIGEYGGKVARRNALAAPIWQGAGGIVSGPGQAFYRRHYENQQTR